MVKKSLSDQVEGLVVTDQGEEPIGTGRKRSPEKGRSRRKSYIMDLCIQSPAALGYFGIEGIDTAPALVRLAKVKGIDVIAVTDYFSADYVDRISAASQGTPVTVLPGVSIRAALPTCNDVILTCLFPEGQNGDHVRAFLRALEVPAQAAGTDRYIIKLPFAAVLQIIDDFQGVAIPSRMDKTPYRKSAIPLLVERYGFRAFDLAYYPESLEIFRQRWPKIKFELLSFSNATALAQVGSRISKVKMADPGFSGLRAIAERAAELSD